MPAKKKTRDTTTPLQSMEEATTLLRGLSPATWLLWFGGTAPWVAVFIHFWNDMSRAADAPQLLIERSLYVALAYLFMKVAHALFADRLLAALRGESSWTPLSIRGWFRLVGSQALIHATMPWVLTLSSLAIIPLGWTYAFYHNVSVLAADTFRHKGRVRDLVKEALKQSHFEAKQNHFMMVLALPFSFLVWANIFIGVITAISLTKSFTGMDSEFSRNPYAFADTGFIAATVGFAFLICGPLIKAIYALRCFHGLSRKNGDDIAVAFRLAAGLRKWPALALTTLLFSLGSLNATAAEEPGMAPLTTVAGDTAPAELRQSIEEVLEKDVYQWRLPRTGDAEAEQTWIAQWIQEFTLWIQGVLESALKWLIEDWLRDLFKDDPMQEPSADSTTPWADISLFVLKALLVLVGALLLVLLVKQWRGLKIAPRPAKAAPAPAVNLESDHVVASQLPEDEWLRLADEKAASGDYRLAMRALFLATLAFLGEKRLVAISRSKSNGDYVRDLNYRARDRDELRSTFRDHVRTFDHAWYGWHDVTLEALSEFRGNHERMTHYGA